MSIHYQATSVTITPIIDQRQITVAFGTQTERISIHMSDRLAADMLVKLMQQTLPTPGASDITKLP